MGKKKSVSQILVEKTYKQLGLDKHGKPKPKKKLGDPKRKLGAFKGRSPKHPFRIPALEKTQRQSPKGKAYRFSALYRNSVILRLLVKKFTNTLNPRKHHRYISQIDAAARSVVANIREGYTRPSTKEYLDFLGFSQGSLEEVRGDVEDAKDDGILASRPGSTLSSIGIILKPHPPKPSHLRTPNSTYDPLKDLKRKIGEIKRNDPTFEIFIELINKTNYLFKRTVGGLQHKISQDENQKLKIKLHNIHRKHW